MIFYTFFRLKARNLKIIQPQSNSLLHSQSLLFSQNSAIRSCDFKKNLEEEKSGTTNDKNVLRLNLKPVGPPKKK
jgi:hypothetical protein